MTQNKFNGVARTSLLVAAMRAVETKRSDSEGRLFSDPFAEILAGPEGLNILESAIKEVGPQPAIAIRTAFIDEKIMNALNSGIRQIVILAAGMDSRPFRLNFPNATKVFELDQPEVLKYKHEKLLQEKPKCDRKTIALDLRDEWQKKLIEVGFNKAEKTLWLVEGLIMYLDENQVTTLFTRINTLAAPDDILLCDIFNRYLLESPFMEKQLNFLASLGAPWKFGTNTPEQFFSDLGWSAQLTQAAEYAPERWPFPLTPRSVPNIPRGFFVEAHKNSQK